MSNDSTTYGPLLPVATGPQVLEGKPLNDFLVGWILGITGIDPGLVRPRWQPEPANLPPAGQPWCAIGIINRHSDTYPYIGHDGAADGGLGQDVMQRHEDLEIMTSWFDLGVNGYADQFCSLLRDGVMVDQNLDPLTAQGFAIVDTGDPVIVPSLMKERWAYRVDMTLALRRNVVRFYPVRNLVKAAGTIQSKLGTTSFATQ